MEVNFFTLMVKINVYLRRRVVADDEETPEVCTVRLSTADIISSGPHNLKYLHPYNYEPIE